MYCASPRGSLCLRHCGWIRDLFSVRNSFKSGSCPCLSLSVTGCRCMSIRLPFVHASVQSTALIMSVTVLLVYVTVFSLSLSLSPWPSSKCTYIPLSLSAYVDMYMSFIQGMSALDLSTHMYNCT